MLDNGMGDKQREVQLAPIRETVGYGEFRRFVILEQEEFLAQKIGDVLTLLQSASADGASTNNRKLMQWAESIVDEMRKILEGRWSKEEEPYLRIIQKTAVALAKAIDNNEKMLDILSGAKGEIEKLQQKIGAPINDLGSSIEKPKGSQAEEQE